LARNNRFEPEFITAAGTPEDIYLFYFPKFKNEKFV